MSETAVGTLYKQTRAYFLKGRWKQNMKKIEMISDINKYAGRIV